MPTRTVKIIFCTIVFFAVCTLLGLGFSKISSLKRIVTEEEQFARIEQELSQLEDIEYQIFFEKNTDSFYKKEGINGMIQRVIKALSTEQIDMFACHSLAHNLGHYAGYPDYFKDIANYLTKENLDFCGSGFMHGVEGQLANNQYPENIDDLYMFCKMSMPLEPYYSGCYHGAGHSFMENTKNPFEAIAQCNLLKVDEDISLKDCYRGAFAEHANLLRNSGQDPKYLLEFCSTLTGEIQKACALELNGLELSPTATNEEINDTLKTCINQAYSKTIQLGCIQSVAITVVDHTLSQKKEIVPSPIVYMFEQDILDEYITSIHGAFIKTATLNETPTLSIFCSLLPKESDKEFCLKLP